MGILDAVILPSHLNRAGLAADRPAASATLAGVTYTYTDAGSATYTGRVDRCDGASWVMIVPPTGSYPSLSVSGFDQFQAVNDSALQWFWAELFKADTSPCDILCIGDSHVEGQGASVIESRFISLFRDLLRTTFQPSGVAGGVGYIPSYYALASTGVLPLPGPIGPTLGGTTTKETLEGLGRRSIKINSAGSVTYTFTGTGVDILHDKTSTGVYSWAIDGGSATNVNVTGGFGNTVGVTSITGLSAGSHTLVIAWVSGTVRINGAMIYNGDETKGIRLWDGAHWGYIARNLLTDGTGAHFAQWSDNLRVVNPDLIVIEFGTNDALATNATSSAQFQTDITTLVSNIRGVTQAANSSMLFWVPYQRTNGALTETWSNYRDALINVALADGKIAVVDAGKRMPSPAADLHSGYPDSIHMADVYHRWVARQLFEAVRPR